ncbi:unnamed protein product [Paramecium octaurelia]|uniref:Uncharacterized protein n=1 Tax=Paramecium octaurelia TaxID=43137 RepID=A0A8S1XHE1_PAROT|nr:unnamed protein product [Paramecium octaurelia]
MIKKALKYHQMRFHSNIAKFELIKFKFGILNYRGSNITVVSMKKYQSKNVHFNHIYILMIILVITELGCIHLGTRKIAYLDIRI